MFKKNLLNFAMLLASYTILAGITFAQTTPHPSFDCRKANGDVEKAICTNAALAHFDSRMSKVWKTLLAAFDDDKMKALIRQSQTAWLAVRDNCKKNTECIGDVYRKRLSELGFEGNPRHFSGQYEAKNIGKVTIYPTADETYLLAIHTADPDQGAWTCEFYGTARGKGSTLLVTVDESSFTVRQVRSDTLTIEANDQVLAIAQKYCGLNGGFSFVYHRIPVARFVEDRKLTHNLH
jgi:uncharacterized protein